MCAADGDVTNPKEALLQWMADVDKYSALHTLSEVLKAVPAVFRLLQGSADFTSNLRDESGALMTAATAVRELVSTLQNLGEPDMRRMLLKTVESKCEAHQEKMLMNSVDLWGELEHTDIAAARASNTINRKAALLRLDAALLKATASLDSSAALPKLKAALEPLDAGDRFLLHSRPVDLPADSDGLWRFFCVPVNERTFALAVKLREQWGSHRTAWTQPAEGAPAPTIPSTISYWKALHQTSLELSTIALLWLLHPTNSASVERVFSYLTDMDRKSRRNMSRETLHDLLFLRGNWQVVHLLQQKFADKLKPREHVSDARKEEASKKRKRVAEDALGAARAKSAVAKSSASSESESQEAEFA